MVNIIKDSRTWEVHHIFKNVDCPYLFYPANYHGCKLLHEDNNACTLENCMSIPVTNLREKIHMENIKTQRYLITDERKIFGLYGPNNHEDIEIGKSKIDKIEAYLEVHNVVWFAIYKDGKLSSRMNSVFVATVVYIQEDT